MGINEIDEKIKSLEEQHIKDQKTIIFQKELIDYLSDVISLMKTSSEFKLRKNELDSIWKDD